MIGWTCVDAGAGTVGAVATDCVMREAFTGGGTAEGFAALLCVAVFCRCKIDEVCPEGSDAFGLCPEMGFMDVDKILGVLVVGVCL